MYLGLMAVVKGIEFGSIHLTTSSPIGANTTVTAVKSSTSSQILRMIDSIKGYYDARLDQSMAALLSITKADRATSDPLIDYLAGVGPSEPSKVQLKTSPTDEFLGLARKEHTTPYIDVELVVDNAKLNQKAAISWLKSLKHVLENEPESLKK
jgi:hypothetical protein